MNQPFGRMLILGHCGAPADAPENTMRSFRLPMAQGADRVELDVQPEADGVPVVIHDDSVDRTTDGRGMVRDLSPAELVRLGAGQGEHIPTLEEVAEWAAESGAWLNAKGRRGSEPAARCRRAGRSHDHDLTCTDFYAVDVSGRADDSSGAGH